MSSTPLSSDQNINSLLSTYQWGTQNGLGSVVTYSFPNASSVWAAGYGTEVTAGWSGLNPVQQLDFQAALGSWAELANVNFVYVADTASGSGQIRVAFSNDVKNSGFAGWGYFPTSNSSAQSGDIWLSPVYQDYTQGNQNYNTMQHEIGHALGLKHPFEAVSGNSAVLTGSFDSTQYTIMSYTDYQGAGYVFVPGTGGSYTYYPVPASTPMLYDVAAIQFLYGANLSTRVGNDVYTFSNSHGELKTIWDAGGIDTFDLSNQSVSQTINLNAGEFSSLGVRQLAYNGPLLSAVDNIAIAYNTRIENAIGGTGDDTLTGNAGANTLRGGAGNDSIDGGDGRDRLFGDSGDDSLNGGSGNDWLNGGAGLDALAGGAGNDTYVVNLKGDTVTELAGADYDTVEASVNWTLGNNIEKLVLIGGGSISGSGNGLNNRLLGNSGSNHLNGGKGNDLLNGGKGADTLIGGAGKDSFLFDNLSGVDAITDFSVTADTIQLENSIFTSLTQTGVLPANEFVLGSAAVDSNDYLVYNQAIGALYYDADGSGAQAETRIATLGSHLALTSADFVVV